MYEISKTAVNTLRELSTSVQHLEKIGSMIKD
jgi:hypothetical protein